MVWPPFWNVTKQQNDIHSVFVSVCVHGYLSYMWMWDDNFLHKPRQIHINVFTHT